MDQNRHNCFKGWHLKSTVHRWLSTLFTKVRIEKNDTTLSTLRYELKSHIVNKAGFNCHDRKTNLMWKKTTLLWLMKSNFPASDIVTSCDFSKTKLRLNYSSDVVCPETECSNFINGVHLFGVLPLKIK